MTAIPFDVFAFTHSLVDAGVPDKQADSIAQAFNKAIQESNTAVIEQIKRDYRLDDVAVKRDIKELELQIELVRKDIEVVRADLKRDVDSIRTDIEKSKNDLIKWFVGTAFALAGFIFMLIRLKVLIVPD